MSTIMDFAIGLSLVNGISGQIQQIVGDFRRLEGVTDEVMGRLSTLKNISITGGILAGAGIKGLQETADVLGECISEAEKLQSTASTLEIKAFGKDLLDQSKLPEIKKEMAELEGKAMDISLNTVFNAQEIEESMISLVKGGMSREMVESSGAEANANFAQINEVSAVSTADATVKFAAGFQLEEEQIKESLDLITKYADASISDSLAIQQNIGNTAGSAMSVWKDRDNMTVAEETIQLVAATKYTAGDEASAATYVRNFLDQAGKTTFTDPQTKMMEDAGWLQDGQSIFIDANTGMLKSAKELEKILEDTAERMDAVGFNNLVDIVFGDRGKKTAQALSQKGGATDLAVLEAGAKQQLTIDDQVAMQMETAAAQAGIFNEAVTTLKATIGQPFLETKAAVLKELNGMLGEMATYLKQHPNVTKFMTAIAVGGSSFLVLAGSIMMVMGLVGSLKTIFAIAGPQIAAFFAPILSTLGIVTAVIAVVAGLAYVIYKNWNTLQPHFANLIGQIQELLGIGKDAFFSFAESVSPIIGSILQLLEKGALLVLTTVVPIIGGALSVLVGILQGDVVNAFASAWNSLNPFARILLTLLAPSLVAVTGCLLMMGAAALASGVKTLVFATYTKVSAAAMAIYRGVLAGAAAIQGIWNIAMTGGVAATVAQKLALAALYPIIMLVKGAKLIWTGVQWALNAALTANPIGVVIMLIAALIGVVALVVTHFKDMVEWVQKGWEKLKGFLGFKSENKEALEEPIDIGITETETIQKEITVTTEADDLSQKLMTGESITELMGGSDVISQEISIQPEYLVTGGIPEEVQGILDTAGVDGTTLSPEVFISPEYQMDMSGIEDLALLEGMPDMTEELDSTVTMLGTGGVDAGKAFTDGLGGAETMAGVQSAMESIRQTIQGAMVKQEEMQQWGSNLVQSFINGMHAKKGALTEAAASLATVIGDYLKVESPSRKGELKTNHLWGGNLIQSFVDGMKGKEILLKDTSALLAQQTRGLQQQMEVEQWQRKDTKLLWKEREPAEQKEEQRPIYILIQGGEKEEIAKEVARELEKRGYGKKKREKSPSMTMSPRGWAGGY